MAAVWIVPHGRSDGYPREHSVSQVLFSFIGRPRCRRVFGFRRRLVCERRCQRIQLLLPSIRFHSESITTCQRAASFCSDHCARLAVSVLVEGNGEHAGELALLPDTTTIRESEGWAVDASKVNVVPTHDSLAGWIPASWLDEPSWRKRGMPYPISHSSIARWQ